MKKQKSQIGLARRSTTEGFTLVETLVAIAVLVLGILGAFTAAQSGISSAILSKDQVIAFYLAAEGIEQIRNIRDENALNGLPWLTGIADLGNDPCNFNSGNSKTCMADAFNNTHLTRCSNNWGSCPLVQTDPNTGAYGYFLNGVNSIYSREIQVYPISPAGCGNTNNPNTCTEVSILVKVTWGKGLVTRTFNARENILNWQ